MVAGGEVIRSAVRQPGVQRRLVGPGKEELALFFGGVQPGRSPSGGSTGIPKRQPRAPVFSGNVSQPSVHAFFGGVAPLLRTFQLS